MPRSRKSQRPKERAKRAAKRANVLPVERLKGRVSATPHIASMNIISKGEYLDTGRGYLVSREVVRETGWLRGQMPVEEETQIQKEKE
jgi:hypothetical protein